MVLEIKNPEKNIPLIIQLSGDLINLIPEFLNNCIESGAFPWDIHQCVSDLTVFSKNIDKLVENIQSKQWGLIWDDAIALVLQLPYITKDCANWTIPIDVSKCMNHVLNIEFEIQTMIQIILNKPIDPELILAYVTNIILDVKPALNDCFLINIPWNINPCIQELSDLTASILELVKEIQKKPLNIPELINKIRVVIDSALFSLDRCAPKLMPNEQCVKDITIITDDAAVIGEEFAFPEINWNNVLEKFGLLIDDFPNVLNDCHK